MAQNTLAENVETAATVIKDVKERIISKGVHIPQGTPATEYPEYIAQMTSKSDFEELKEKVSDNRNDIDTIKTTTLWGREWKENVYGNMDNVGTIQFLEDDTYNVGTNEKRPAAVRARNRVAVGKANHTNDGETGVVLGNSGVVAITVSKEDTSNEVNPRIRFYYEGATEPTSSIREATPGVLSIPQKLRIGGTATGEQNNELHVDGTSRFEKDSYFKKTLYMGEDKTNYQDGNSGICISPNQGAILLQTSEESTESPRISFYRGSTTNTSRLAEGYPGVLSVTNKLNIGEELNTDMSYTLRVKGTGHFDGGMTAASYNGVELTNQGDETTFLSADGSYKRIDVNALQNELTETKQEINELKQQLSALLTKLSF